MRSGRPSATVTSPTLRRPLAHARLTVMTTVTYPDVQVTKGQTKIWQRACKVCSVMAASAA